MNHKTNLEDIDNKLKFALHIIFAIQMLQSYENNPQQASAALVAILMEAGYNQEDSYSAAVGLQQLGQYSLLNEQEITVALPTLVSMAANAIDKKVIPDFIRQQVRTVLADQQNQN